MTMRASYILAHLEFLGDAMSNLLQRQTNLQTEVTATMNLRTTLGTSAKTAETCVSTKDIAEHREDVVHVH